MRTIILPSLLFIISGWACNANTRDDDASLLKDSVGLVRDSVSTPPPGNAADTTLLGFYHGVLPCKDCQGVRHTLLLRDSGRYRLEEFILGKSTFPKKVEGMWSKAGDSIRLYSNREHIATYYSRNDTLRVTFREGMAIADSIAKNFWISRQPAAAANVAWQQKAQQGVEFYAIGNEPFWNVEVGKGRALSFRLADLPNPITFGAATVSPGKDSTTYSATKGNDRIQVTIFNEFCNDGMSDNYYEHRVHVRYNGELYKGCGTYMKK